MHSDPIPPGRPRPVILMAAVLATLQALVASSQLVDLLPGKWAPALALVVGALTVGWGVYAQGQVTPLAAPRDAQGRALVPAGTRRAPGDGA